MRFSYTITAMILSGLFWRGAARADTTADLADLVVWMQGHMSSADQVAEDPEARMRHVYATHVDIPALTGEDIYLEWHSETPDGPIDSQRIWIYQAMDDHIAMHFFTFKEAADAALTGIRKAGDGDAAAIAALTRADFTAYPPECTFILYRDGNVIEGKNGTGDCRIYNRTLGVWMLPDVSMRITPDGFWEAGTYVYEPETDAAEPPPTLVVVQDFRRAE